MTSSTATMNNNGKHDRGSGCCGFGASANWSVTNIVAMVIGFVLFWPIGLFILYWILKGRNVMDMRSHLSEKWNRFKGNETSEASGKGNQVFNEYQQTQFDRIREIKDEIKERARRFADFRSDAKRRADEEEFRRFMDDSPSQK
ncbi:MAG: DUF2852 domain-containing protein [Gammaproteobacteria bacterium]|nr:DUF2852 domain-containing protein [Gammaproteobacteria bacterium]